MSDDRQAALQKHLQKHFRPERAAAVEAESRQWMMICPHCGFKRSVWDMGQIRYKAAGSPREYRQCPQCGRSGWNKIVWEGPERERTSPGFVVKLVLAIVGGVLLLVTAILLLVFWLTGII